MKLLILILFFTALQAQANNALGQSISLNLKNTDVRSVLTEIEKHTRYRFIYNYDLTGLKAPLDFEVREASLPEVLDKLLAGNKLTYKKLNKNLVAIVSTLEQEKKQIKITGKVVNAKGDPLAGASVTEKGTSNSVVTNEAGQYTITVNEAAVLIVSAVGFEKQEIVVGNQTVIRVKMVAVVASLEEVIVVGYGTQRKEALTGSVSQVEAKDFNKRPITNASQALQGVASGVLVSQSSGEPGRDGAQITVRGISTFSGNNDAFVLVDGVPASLAQINPNDIASISVLKDASASAIYGSRAANGVILVTTKRGSGGKAKFTVDGYTGVQVPTRLPNLVTDPLQWMELHNLAREVPDASGNITAPFYTGAMIEEYKKFAAKTGFKGTNMFDELFNPAPINRVDASASGGNEFSRYFVSTSYLKQTGVGKGSKYEQGTFRLNFDSKLNKWMRIGTSITGMLGKNNRPSGSEGSGQFDAAWVWRPTTPAVLEDGSYPIRKFFRAGEWGPNYTNPLAFIDNGLNKTIRLHSLGTAYLEIEPIKRLVIKGVASGNIKTDKSTVYNPVLNFYWPSDFYSETTPGLLTVAERSPNPAINNLAKSNTSDINTMFQLTGAYDFTVGKDFDFEVLAGASQELFRNEKLSASTSDFSQEGIYEIGDMNVEKELAGSSSDLIAFRSYFGRVNVDYLGKYYLTANFRADATSRFAPESRWGYFPSVGAGWVVSKEKFYHFAPLNFLKLRASYGQLGNQATGSQYLYISSVNQGGGFNYNFDGNLAIGAGPSSIPNRNAVWEVSTKTDLGIETRWLKNSITANFTYFRETRSGQLLSQPVPNLIGDIKEPVKNLAEVNIWGWELDLGYRKSFGKLNVGVSANLAHAQNKVIKIAEGIEQIVRGPSNTTIIKPGHPIDQLFLIQDNGLYQSDEKAQDGPKIAGGNTAAGDIAYIDQNGDGVISGRNAIEDKVPVGRPYPNLNYGFGINLEYMGIDLSVQANGVAGVDYWATYQGVEAFGAQGGIPKRYLTESYTFNKVNPTLPRLVYQWNYSGNEGLAFPSTYYLLPGGYLRIKNIQLGYTFPQSISKRLGMESTRIYFNAQNPFIFTRLFDDADPERQLNNNGSQSFSGQPQVKIWSAGIRVVL